MSKIQLFEDSLEDTEEIYLTNPTVNNLEEKTTERKKDFFQVLSKPGILRLEEMECFLSFLQVASLTPH